jgi:hypothetical protein
MEMAAVVSPTRTKAQRDLPAVFGGELGEFRAEAEELLGNKNGPRPEK